MLAFRIESVGDQIAHGRVFGQRNEAVPEALCNIDGTPVDVVKEN